jgi:hypothetical protein
MISSDEPFFARSYIIDVLVGVRLLEQRIVLLLIRRCRIVEYDDSNRVSVPPEVFVVLLDGFAYVAQPVRRNDKR